MLEEALIFVYFFGECIGEQRRRFLAAAAGHGEEEAGAGAAGPAGPDAGAARPRGGELAQGAGEEADAGVVPDRLR